MNDEELHAMGWHLPGDDHRVCRVCGSSSREWIRQVMEDWEDWATGEANAYTVHRPLKEEES